MSCPSSARERSTTIGFCVTPEQARRIALMLAREFSATHGGEEPSDVEREDALIFGMSRRCGRREATKRCSPRQENGVHCP